MRRSSTSQTLSQISFRQRRAPRNGLFPVLRSVNFADVSACTAEAMRGVFDQITNFYTENEHPSDAFIFYFENDSLSQKAFFPVKVKETINAGQIIRKFQIYPILKPHLHQTPAVPVNSSVTFAVHNISVHKTKQNQKTFFKYYSFS
jgi:hypothetical protein